MGKSKRGQAHNVRQSSPRTPRMLTPYLNALKRGTYRRQMAIARERALAEMAPNCPGRENQQDGSPEPVANDTLSNMIAVANVLDKTGIEDLVSRPESKGVVGMDVQKDTVVTG